MLNERTSRLQHNHPSCLPHIINRISNRFVLDNFHVRLLDNFLNLVMKHELSEIDRGDVPVFEREARV